MGKNGVGLAPKIFIKLIHYGTSQNTPSSEMEVKERNMHKKKQIIFAIKFFEGAQSYILKLQGGLASPGYGPAHHCIQSVPFLLILTFLYTLVAT